MRKTLALLLLPFLATPALADPIPTFHSPEALLDGVYGQIEASLDWENYDWESSFSEHEAFSARLTSLLEEANEKFYAAGDEIGALDFSVFSYSQDPGGMEFTFSDAKTKGDRSIITVDIALEGKAWHSLTFFLVDEGAAGWKVDDVLFPPFEEDAGEPWKLSEYLADPDLP
ncbi:hypothetical protein [Devosia sediminis]|uniref:DUF3828 domain-containing protein n=1 Tax=Devosia sediminis TaxID=2798801 RepID=A0A934IWZ8_9HYPH|nr:hypothetical protein [Devosia sediminis]MBJ3783770.1 hypothetical protein [Devosia sediminis]